MGSIVRPRFSKSKELSRKVCFGMWSIGNIVLRILPIILKQISPGDTTKLGEKEDKHGVKTNKTNVQLNNFNGVQTNIFRQMSGQKEPYVYFL